MIICTICRDSYKLMTKIRHINRKMSKRLVQRLDTIGNLCGQWTIKKADYFIYY